MSKIKNGGLDQYGAGPFEQQQFGTAGIERVNDIIIAAREGGVVIRSVASVCVSVCLVRALSNYVFGMQVPLQNV